VELPGADEPRVTLPAEYGGYPQSAYDYWNVTHTPVGTDEVVSPGWNWGELGVHQGVSPSAPASEPPPASQGYDYWNVTHPSGSAAPSQNPELGAVSRWPQVSVPTEEQNNPELNAAGRWPQVSVPTQEQNNSELAAVRRWQQDAGEWLKEFKKGYAEQRQGWDNVRSAEGVDFGAPQTPTPTPTPTPTSTPTPTTSTPTMNKITYAPSIEKALAEAAGSPTAAPYIDYARRHQIYFVPAPGVDERFPGGAVTLGNLVLLGMSYDSSNKKIDPPQLIHEIVHVIQNNTRGTMPDPSKYILGSTLDREREAWTVGETVAHELNTQNPNREGESNRFATLAFPNPLSFLVDPVWLSFRFVVSHD